MRLRGAGELQRWVRRACEPFLPSAVILLYHRVFDASRDPQLLCVSARHFAEHLEYMRTRYSTLRLKDLVGRLRRGLPPKRAVVVTFDDGYSDNLWKAKPLLERYDVPATVFVTAGYVGENKVFWWEKLDRILLQPRTLPETLCLTINGNPFKWELGEAVHFSDDDYRCHQCWNVLEKDRPTARHGLYFSLCELLRPLAGWERDAVLAELEAWAGDEPANNSDHRALTTDEVIQLAEGELVEVGAHTMTHSVLSALPLEVQQAEIVDGKQRLEQTLGQRITSFSYPFGGRGDYTLETVKLVKESGLQCACSNFPSLVTLRSDPYQLPRFLVRDWDGEEFGRRLRKWFRS